MTGRPAAIGTIRRTAAMLAACVAVLALVAATAPSAHASELVARNATQVTLKVNASNTALVEYTDQAGTRQRVLFWGAINHALRFRKDRSGGWRSKRASWQGFTNVCGQYRGPQLAYALAACTMPDGTHWALQSWMREVKNYGGAAGAVDLRISHFSGPLASLWIRTDWHQRGRFAHMYGQFIYQGKPVVAVRFKPNGYVLDGIGRNIAVDSWNSDYGQGWRRVNAFLSHSPNGQFCFGFSPKIPGDPRTGRSTVEWYRATVAGPGVSPDVMTYFRGQLTGYDANLDAQHNYWQGVLANWATSGICSKRS